MPPRSSPPRLTHFLCIPLVTPRSRPQLQSSLDKFRADVTNDRTPENPDGIPEGAIRPTGTLHLTLGVMSLLSQERVDSALKLLAGLNLMELLSDRKSIPVEGGTDTRDSGDGAETKGKIQEESKPKELKVTLRGLTSMHTPSKTSILYSAPVDENHSLQSFCQKLRDAFAEADLLVPDTRPLLLHATIVNTIYVPGIKGKGTGHGKNRAKLTIDARDILEKYEDFEWVSDVKLNKVAICKMGAKKLEDGNEEYEVEGEVNMP
jgi:activating signal cointegrator complex subunit 1